jgi:hypothetical protein
MTILINRKPEFVKDFVFSSGEFRGYDRSLALRCCERNEKSELTFLFPAEGINEQLRRA